MNFKRGPKKTWLLTFKNQTNSSSSSLSKFQPINNSRKNRSCTSTNFNSRIYRYHRNLSSINHSKIIRRRRGGGGGGRRRRRRTRTKFIPSKNEKQLIWGDYHQNMKIDVFRNVESSSLFHRDFKFYCERFDRGDQIGMKFACIIYFWIRQKIENQKKRKNYKNNQFVNKFVELPLSVKKLLITGFRLDQLGKKICKLVPLSNLQKDGTTFSSFNEDWKQIDRSLTAFAHDWNRVITISVLNKLNIKLKKNGTSRNVIKFFDESVNLNKKNFIHLIEMYHIRSKGNKLKILNPLFFCSSSSSSF